MTKDEIFQEMSRQIQIATTRIYKRNMRGGPYEVILDGPLGKDFYDLIMTYVEGELYKTYLNRWKASMKETPTSRNVIQVIRRGDHFKAEACETAKCIDEAGLAYEIPELYLKFTSELQPDDVEEIDMDAILVQKMVDNIMK